jgi:hypothetical protein
VISGLRIRYPTITDYYTQSQVDSKIDDLIIYIDQQDLEEFNRLITASGDLVTWVLNKNYVTLEQLTTTSGDIVAQIQSASVNLIGTGGIETSYVGDDWYIDGSNIGGGGGSLACATCDSGILTVESGVETPYVRFSDGSVATTKQDVTGCSGVVTTVNATIAYNDTFPKLLFELPPQHEITSIELNIGTTFSGGTGSVSSPPTTATPSTGMSANATYVLLGSKMIPGATITHIKGYSSTGVAGVKFKLCKQITTYAYDLTNITVSGGVATCTIPGGQYTQQIDPVVVPTDGDYYIAVRGSSTIAMGLSALGSSYGTGTAYKSTDDVGASFGFNYSTSSFPLIQAVFSPGYSIGDALNHESLLETFYPTTSGLNYYDGNLVVGDGWGPEVYSSPIYAYFDGSADVKGELSLTITYTKVCYDSYFTELEAGTNIYIERNTGNNYSISAVPECYQSSCTQMTTLPYSSASESTRMFLLPANHVLTTVTGNGSIVGGSAYTVGISDLYTSLTTNATQVATWYKLTNGTTINQVWINCPSVRTLKIKLAKEITFGSIYEFTDIATINHPGTGEVAFDITPTTVTGVGEDVFRIALHGPVSMPVFSSTSNNCYYKAGDCIGYTTGVTSNNAYTPSIRVGYSYSYALKANDSFQGYIPPSGVFGLNPNYGPYNEVTPFYIVPTATGIEEPPTDGSIDLTFRYYNPSYVVYTMGTATWSGLDGSPISHNLGTTDHFLFVSPVDQNPGDWWVSKGNDTDYVYTLTLSGSGQFDWFIQH